MRKYSSQVKKSLARSEDRNVIMRISPLCWAGLEWQNPLSGITAYFTPASPTKRVFYCPRFHLIGVHCFLTATQVPNKPKLPNQAKLFVAALAGKYRVIGETVVQGCRLVSSDIGVGPTCLSRKTSTDKGCKQRQANSMAG